MQSNLACVASVSNRVIVRKLFLFLLSSQLSRRTRAETLATQAKSNSTSLLNSSDYGDFLVYLAPGGGGHLGIFRGGYVPPGTPSWHPVLKKISPQIDTPF